MIKTIAATTGIIIAMRVSVLFAARLFVLDELVGLVAGYEAVVLFFVPPFVAVVRFGKVVFGVVKPFGIVDGTVVFGIVKTCDKVVGTVVSAKVTDADFSVVVTGGCISLLISNGSKGKVENNFYCNKCDSLKLTSLVILHYFWSADLQLIVSVFTFPSQ